MVTDEIVYTETRVGNWIMLSVGLWGGAKGNSHIGKGHRAGASVYFGHMSSFFFIRKCGCDEYIIVQNVQSSTFGIGIYSITPLVKKRWRRQFS